MPFRTKLIITALMFWVAGYLLGAMHGYGAGAGDLTLKLIGVGGFIIGSGLLGSVLSTYLQKQD